MGEIVSLVVGTAGHIDHGKSSLVRRLTGVDPDRLKEERERELTIDLGFAPYRLPDGRTLGIIDVPGHERFVKNMVAGATGTDLVLLVVAADDGVMPQTREHLEILTLLGLRHGLIVLTKIDAPGVDDDMLGVIELELEELLAGTFVAGAPVVRVSSVTGEGFDALERELIALVARVAPELERRAEGAFRLPIQRVFSARGFGTVVTGVPLGGALELGEPLEVITAAGALRGRVRGLQAYGQTVTRIQGGHSSAINVADVSHKGVRRGDTAATPGVFQAATLFEVRLTHLPSQLRPLRQRETVRFHVGTSEVLGELVLLDAKALAPGESGLAQVRLREPLVAAPGDRFVVRRHSPMETIGGGALLGASRWRLKPFKGFVLDRLSAEEEALGDAARRLILALDQGDAPQRSAQLVQALARPKDEVEALLGGLAERGEVVDVSGGKGQPAYLSAAGLARAEERAVAALAEFHAEHPLRDGLARLELRARSKLPDGTLQRAVAELSAAGRVRENAAGFALAEHAPALGEAEEALVTAVLALFQAGAFTPPTPAQALEQVARPEVSARDAQDLVANLLDRGELVAVGEDVVFHRERYEEARSRVIATIQGQGPLAAAAFKDALGSSRRYVIPLLEHFDEVGLTRREGDVRVLRQEG